MTTFLFKANNGEMNLGSDYNLARFRQHLKENEGKVFRIEREITTRSMTQNKFYWFYLGIIERETGNSANDLHEYFKRILLLPVFVKVMGQEIKIPRSTTSLKKSEFAEYLDKINALTSVEIPSTERMLEELSYGSIDNIIKDKYKNGKNRPK